MQRMLVLAAVAALALAAAPAAVAKEITKAEVCGARRLRRRPTTSRSRMTLLGRAARRRTPPTAAPYYEVRIDDGRRATRTPTPGASPPCPTARRALRADDGTWMRDAARDGRAIVKQLTARPDGRSRPPA